jgi:hypothetical protein
MVSGLPTVLHMEWTTAAAAYMHIGQLDCMHAVSSAPSCACWHCRCTCMLLFRIVWMPSCLD